MTEQANSEKSPSEPELRARIAAGSREAADYLELADLLKSGSRFQEAAGIYEHGLRLDLPNVDQARFAFELGSLLDGTTGRKAEARSLAHRALSLLSDQGESRDVLLLRGLSQSLLAHAVWFEDAEAGAEASRIGVHWLERVVQEYGHDRAAAGAYYELARLHNALGNPDRAIGFCRQYLHRKLDEHERLAALMVLAEALEQAGQVHEAEATTREALRYAEEHDKRALPNLYVTLGLIQRAGNRRTEARASFEEALRRVQEDPFRRDDLETMRTLFWRLAELHCETGNFPEAASVLTKLLAECPEDRHRQRALIWRAECYASMGQPARARRDYEQVLASTAALEEERTAAREGLAALPSQSS